MNLTDIDASQLLEALYDGVLIHAVTGEIEYANPQMLRLLGVNWGSVQGLTIDAVEWCLLDLSFQPVSADAYPAHRAVAEQQSLHNIEFALVTPSNPKITWVICHALLLHDALGTLSKILVTFTDISARKTAISFENIVANANDIILVTESSPLADTGPRIVYVNRAFCQLTGYTASEVIGKTPRMFQGPATNPEVRQRIKTALQQQAPVRERILNYSKTGSPYWLEMNIFPLKNDVGEVLYFAAVEHDVTAQVAKEQTLLSQAIEDPLTGLLNRRGFLELYQQTTESLSSARTSSLIMMDIDHFKQINDSYGHDIGDQVLRHVATVFRHGFRETDLVCRYGGEEFVALMLGVDPVVSQLKMDQLRIQIAQTPLVLESNQPIAITVSLGITAYLPHQQPLDEALTRADKALYQAKHGGRNCCVMAPSAPRIPETNA